MSSSSFGLGEFIAQGGLIGLLILLLTLMLLPASVYTTVASKDRRVHFMMLLAAFAPILLGLAGTAIGMAMVERVLESSPGEASPLEYQEGKKAALVTTWMGLFSSIVLIGITSFPFLVGRGELERA